MKVDNQLYVKSYYVEVMRTGVIALYINTTQNGCYFHTYNDNTFFVTSTEEEYESGDTKFIFSTPYFIPKVKDTHFIRTTWIEDNQIMVYYIPWNRKDMLNRKFLIE